MKFTVTIVVSAVFWISGLSLQGASPEKDRLKGGVIKSEIEADVCVYGASPAGVLAAVAAAREGCSVVIVEPTYTIGGLLASGFRMQQDVPDPQHLGGLTRDYFDKDVALHVGIHAPTLRHYQGAGEDNVAMLQEYIDRYADLITVVLQHRVAFVETEEGEIEGVVFEYAVDDENGVPSPVRSSDHLRRVEAEIYVDASYEGDLMAFSGVSYRVGRESREEYGESLAGVVVSREFPGVDPYKVKGDPSSGLLSPIFPDPIGEEGEASRFFMSWNFKLAWETKPTEEYPGIPITPPENKDEDVYELLRRSTEAGYPTRWPDSNFDRRQLMTGAIPGMQTDYPDGDWATRSKIWQAFIDHVKTLTDFSGKEVRLLSDYRNETNGWPYLYMRGGRRMIGEYVMTQQDLQLQTDIPTPIGMGYYKVDIYPTRLAVNDEGVLVQEGDVFTMVSPGPYQIPYGAIIPKRDEIANLLVPMMMSASHVAYASIRMEGTYMVMGESAGIAAGLAVRSGKAVQDIDRDELTALLKAHGQELEWDGTGFYTEGLWRSNIFGKGSEQVGRWETHPEEYAKYPVETLWKSKPE
ncbi:MAG: FAD-dependent oxidoreductase [Verrucomicrobiaceae bacterium]|nr:FAD-dependent oxidoreductase [Verrucomicrobiaceae bacterium]